MTPAVTRRRALSAAAFPLALGACSGPGQATSGQTGAPLSQEAATITFLGRGSITNQQSFEELSRRFTQEVAPKVTVQYTHEPGNFDEKYQVLASGGQTPDVAFGTVANYKVHVARGSAAYLDELAKRDKAFKEADYDAYWLEALRYKSRLSGLPWDPGMVVLQFNRNVFNKEGLKTPDTATPMTWEDVAELSRRFVKEGTQLDQVGLEIWWDRMWWHMPRQMGLPDVYKGDEHVIKLDSPLAIDAIQFMADLRLKFKVSRPVTYNGPATNFVSGKLAMNAGGAWEAANNRVTLQDDWDWAPLPQFRGKQRVTMGQASPVILAGMSKAKDQSWQFMRYLAGPVGQEMAMEKGTSQPILKAQSNSPVFTKLRPPHTHKVVVDETKYAVPPPYGPTYTDVQAAVSRILTPVYRGEQTARQAITAGIGELKQLMEESKSRFG
ncbi:MAG TPA: extracellular solute-binding protein [Chloroflexota bacterium]|nr:extracellular solute-binding protein [Chloroflexota bacterium]